MSDMAYSLSRFHGTTQGLILHTDTKVHILVLCCIQFHDHELQSVDLCIWMHLNYNAR